MKRFELNVPTFGFAVATRAMIGAGLGLLLSDRIARKRRRAIGFTLLGIGAASTVPVVRALIRGRKETAF
jgi:F0F1-type ATP synthase assembly protein I